MNPTQRDSTSYNPSSSDTARTSQYIPSEHPEDNLDLDDIGGIARDPAPGDSTIADTTPLERPGATNVDARVAGDVRAEERYREQLIDPESTNRGPGPEVMAADTLRGDKVVNNSGESLGDLQNIMIDVPTGRVAYAVLSVGGFLGIGDKLFAVPWKALRMDPANHQFVLDVAKEQLDDAPGFDKDHWPSMADATWATKIHAYYGSAPYWE